MPLAGPMKLEEYIVQHVAHLLPLKTMYNCDMTMNNYVPPLERCHIHDIVTTTHSNVLSWRSVHTSYPSSILAALVHVGFISIVECCLSASRISIK